MKINKLHLLRNMAALLLCASAASCSQDDLGIEQGEPLPPGKYPLTLTASVEGMNTRSTGKDGWAEGDKIGVRIGADGATGCYILNPEDGTVKEALTPVYWQSTDPATVTAWYPFEARTAKDITDQSKGYEDIDFLKAIAENKRFTDKVELNFIHQMAKVSYTLKKGDGITDNDLDEATVQIAGYTKVSFSEGKLTGTDDGWITPTADREALLVPKDMTDRPFIKVSISGKDFIYTPGAEDTGNLQAGRQHFYTITLKANGIEVTAATGGSWDDGGSEDVKSREVQNRYADSDLKPGDYYYSDGTWSDGGLRTIYTDGTYRIAAVAPSPGKTVIGIVFHVGQHKTDRSDYTKPLTEDGPTIPNGKVNGYVVALTDATSGYCMWGVLGTELGCYPTNVGGNKLDNFSKPDIDWNGYAWTQKIITAAGGEAKLNATEEAGYPATYYAVVAYETVCQAPANSSGWFLPSIGQMWNIYRNRSSLFNGKAVVSSLDTDRYWSSSEYYCYPMSSALIVKVSDRDVDSLTKCYSESYVRPVLAF